MMLIMMNGAMGQSMIRLTVKPINGFIRFSNANTLKVSGYIGKQWMGLNRTVVWTKETQLRK